MLCATISTFTPIVLHRLKETDNMILEMLHQPNSKEPTYNHTSIQAQNTKTQETTPSVHTQKTYKTTK
jgi:hypothetical protein